MNKDECADWIAEDLKVKKAEAKRQGAEEKKKEKATVERKRLEAEERTRLEAEEKKKEKATVERKRLEAEEKKKEKATVERKRLAEMPPNEAATAKRAKVKRDDAESDKRDAALYLETNKQYAIDFMATNKSRITEAVSDIKKWSVDEKNRRFSKDQLPGVRSVGKKWEVQLRFSGRAWNFGRFETIQTANYACHIIRGIVGHGLADMKDNILNVDLAKMAIDAGLKALS